MLNDFFPKSLYDVNKNTVVTSSKLNKKSVDEFFTVTVKKNRDCEKVFLKFANFNLQEKESGLCTSNQIKITENTVDVPKNTETYCGTDLQGKNMEILKGNNKLTLINYEFWSSRLAPDLTDVEVKYFVNFTIFFDTTNCPALPTTVIQTATKAVQATATKKVQATATEKVQATATKKVQATATKKVPPTAKPTVTPTEPPKEDSDDCGSLA